ncbi:hypothetical protein ACN47E_010045 [Coniothyrium glycines]
MLLSSAVLLALFAATNAAGVTTDARCGSNGKTCLGSKWGSCCSQYDYCGSTEAYCDTNRGCQSGFGSCNGVPSSPRPSSGSTPAQPVSKNARCGVGFGGSTCLGSKWGDCCSQYSYCGSTDDYCAVEKSCQTAYGRCKTKPSNSIRSFSTVVISRSPSLSPSLSIARSSSTGTSSKASSTLTSSTSALASSIRSDSSSVVTSKTSSSSRIRPTPTEACSPVDEALEALNAGFGSQVSSYCLSYLGGDRTVQQTSTQIISGPARTIVVTEPDQTQQATVDVTNVQSVVVTSIVQQPDPTVTRVVTVVAGTRTVYQRRRNEGHGDLDARLVRDLPFVSQRISSACSCIVTPVIRTVQATQIQSTDGPQVTQTQPGATVLVTVYQTVQITAETTVNLTVPPTATAVQSITTVVTPILVKPKICNARGLPGANAFNYDANFNSNQASCIASCKTDARCLATGFYIVTNPGTGTQSGTCRKYDKSVTDSADLGPGYYNFNDKAC